jgi:cell division septation protein DedD
VAGGTRDRVSFGPSAVDLIAQRSGGVPRLINLICDRALHRGHLAHTSLMDSDIVRVALVDLGLADAIAPPIPTAIQELSAPSALPMVPTASAFDSKKLFESMEPKQEHEHIIFEAHDLPHTERIVSLDPAPTPAVEASSQKLQAQAAPTAATTDERPSLFESRGIWAAQAAPPGRRRWRRRTRRMAVAVAVLALIVAGSYGQALWEESVEIITAPTPPPSPLEAFALNFQPKRAAERVPLIPDAAADNAPLTTPPIIFAIDVALFNSTRRASRLVTELTTANYHAYVRDLDLGDRGHLYEVMVGPFASREEAATEAARIHAIPGYEDARVVSSAP